MLQFLSWLRAGFWPSWLMFIERKCFSYKYNNIVDFMNFLIVFLVILNNISVVALSFNGLFDVYLHMSLFNVFF